MKYSYTSLRIHEHLKKNSKLLYPCDIQDILERFSRAAPRGRGREWATPGVHPLSWLLSNNRLEKVPVVSVLHTSSNRLLLSNQNKGCTPSDAHSLPLPLGPALLNLSSIGRLRGLHPPQKKIDVWFLVSLHSWSCSNHDVVTCSKRNWIRVIYYIYFFNQNSERLL